MARKSAEALGSVAGSIGTRLEAPTDLTELERTMWVQVVDSKPANWFDRDSEPVLKEYVRAAVTCDVLGGHVAKALASGDLVEAAQADKLLLARDRESRRVASLATKLRLTQQSRYTPQAANTANNRAGGKRLWDS